MPLDKDKLIQKVKSGQIKTDTDLAIYTAVAEAEDTMSKQVEEVKSDTLAKIDKIENKFDSTVEEIKKNTPNLEQILATIKGKDGKDGKDAVVDYAFLIKESVARIPKPKDGVTPEIDYRKIVDEAVSLIPKPKDGETPEVDYDFIIQSVQTLIKLPEYKELTGEEIVSKINALPIKPEQQIGIEHIRGLKEMVAQNGMAYTRFAGASGVNRILAGTNITISATQGNGQGDVTINSTATGGASAFTDLTDVPSSYTGQTLKIVRVKADESGLEFVSPSGEADTLADVTGRGATTAVESTFSGGLITGNIKATDLSSSIDVNNRQLLDSGNTTEIDWENALLKVGSATSYNWKLNEINDTAFNSKSIAPNEHKLYKSDGTTASFDWQNLRFPTLTSNGFVKTSGGDGTLSIDTTSYQPAGTYVTSVSGTADRITSSGGTTPVIDIAATYVGQTSITTLGTITTGVWNGTAIANANLANSAISGIALGSDLADLTATDTTLTFSGAYNGGTARTVGLNLANANTWTAKPTIQLTTEQLRIGYDASNYTTKTVSSIAGVTDNIVGTTPTYSLGLGGTSYFSLATGSWRVGVTTGFSVRNTGSSVITSVSGVDTFTVGNGFTLVGQQLRVANNSVSVPAIAFTSIGALQATGFNYLPSHTIQFVTNGVATATLSPTTFTMTGADTAATASFVHPSTGVAITTPFPAFELVNPDATANNFTTLAFTDSASGPAYALLGGQCTDHTNNYGNFNIWTRSTNSAAIRMTFDAASGASATSNFINCTNTFPTTLSAETTGALFNYTTAGSSNQSIRAVKATLSAGYTGAGQTAALRAENFVAGTGASIGTGGTVGNLGVIANSTATASGLNIGNNGIAYGGNANVGMVGMSMIGKNSSANIGMLGYAYNTGTGTVTQTGGYFRIGNGDVTLNTEFASAALLVDNTNTTDPIALFRDNGTTVASIIDGGILVTTSGRRVAYVAKTANYTLTTTDYLVDCTANSFDITLPTAVGVTGQTYKVKNSGTGIITLKTTSSQTIDGTASGVMTLVQYDSISLVSNGANWIVI